MDDETQDECLCCCGIRKQSTTQIDGDTVDGGGKRLKTCLCCWCMGCSQEGVYIWLKNLLLLYNFVFWLIGCGFLALGIYSGRMRQEYSDEADLVLLTPAVILSLIGSLSFIFSTLGFVGALRDNLCFLKVFVYSILVFLVIELTSGILALVFKEPAKDFVNRFVLKGLTTYYDDQDLRDVVDYIQREFECCGGEFYTDWEVNIYHNCSSPGPKACGVPFTCCIWGNSTFNINSMCGYGTLNMKPYQAAQYINIYGCTNAVLDFLYLNLDIVAAILLGILLPQVTGVILGLLYVISIEKIISKRADDDFQEQHKINIRALDDSSLYIDEDKRMSYPLYVRKPSMLSVERLSPTASIYRDNQHEDSESDIILPAGDVLMSLQTSDDEDISGGSQKEDSELEIILPAGDVLMSLQTSDDEITDL